MKQLTPEQKKEFFKRHILYWHVHHEQLIEICYGVEERQHYIKKEKPENQRAIRLKALKVVKEPAKLPEVILYEMYVHEHWALIPSHGNVFDALMRQHRREYPKCTCNEHGHLVHPNGSEFED